MNSLKKIKWQGLAFGGLLAFAQAASAHTGHLPTDGFGHGFLHPFLGLDHFLVMLGLGLWASTQLPKLAGQTLALFLLFMLAGALSGLAGLGFMYTETAILVSLLLVGAALSVGTHKLPKSALLAAIAVFAAMHGLAHGGEMPSNASGTAYLTGMMAATAMLLLSGRGLGVLLKKGHANHLLRLYGAMTGMAGAWLLFTA